MNNTEQMNLALPGGSDYVDIETLNENWRKIDAAHLELISLIEGRAQVVCGSYVGTGVEGLSADNPMMLTFPFVPKFVCLMGTPVNSGANQSATYHSAFYVNGVSEEYVYGSSIGKRHYTLDGTTLKFYAVDGYIETAMNRSGREYHYVAIG